MVILTKHILDRLSERGATKEEIIITIENGEEFPAKYGRTGFRSNFLYNSEWNGKYYATKQIEVLAINEKEEWIAITVIVKYF